jgi:hypothetical protein
MVLELFHTNQQNLTDALMALNAPTFFFLFLNLEPRYGWYLHHNLFMNISNKLFIF